MFVRLALEIGVIGLIVVAGTVTSLEEGLDFFVREFLQCGVECSVILQFFVEGVDHPEGVCFVDDKNPDTDICVDIGVCDSEVEAALDMPCSFDDEKSYPQKEQGHSDKKPVL